MLLNILLLSAHVWVFHDTMCLLGLFLHSVTILLWLWCYRGIYSLLTSDAVFTILCAMSQLVSVLKSADQNSLVTIHVLYFIFVSL